VLQPSEIAEHKKTSKTFKTINLLISLPPWKEKKSIGIVEFTLLKVLIFSIMNPLPGLKPRVSGLLT